jgi:hypothetical protein
MTLPHRSDNEFTMRFIQKSQVIFSSVVIAVATVLAASSVVAGADDALILSELDQGWQSQRTAWYLATQGSRLMPLVWMQSLEQPRSTQRFLEPSYIASFGYLPMGDSSEHPLPIGFVRDTGPDGGLQRTRLRWKVGQGEQEPWIGLNCSACHTTQLQYGDRADQIVRIDGGPSISNFQSFVNSLNLALVETRDDADKWSRFAGRVLAWPDRTPQNEQLLRKAFDDLVSWQLLEAKVNEAGLVYGPGRVDAFGHIFNKVALLLGGANITGNPSDAPVSIPFIWRAPQLDKVQYNGIASKILVANGSLDIGAVGRNTGEVIGVFGDVVTHQDPGILNGFKSSLKVNNLIGLEDILAQLRPPAWPSSAFGPAGNCDVEPKDKCNAAHGKELYDQHCISCHEVVDRKNLTKQIEVQMNLFNGMGQNTRTRTSLPPPGTDPWMACNAFDYKASPGPLKGFQSRSLTDGKKIPDPHELGDLLRITVASTLLDQKGNLIEAIAGRLIGLKPAPNVEAGPAITLPTSAKRTDEKRNELARCLASNHPNVGYTSRPLNGVWATAPFLHNGSVPTLYDLLLPPLQRPKSFYLGTRRYDPKKLGFLIEKNEQAGNTFEFHTRDNDGIIIDGNSNEGHDYSNGQLNDNDRYSIIEYLKTL